MLLYPPNRPYRRTAKRCVCAGTAEFVGQTDVDDLGGRWHVHRTSSSSATPEIIDPPRAMEGDPEQLLLNEFYQYVTAGVEPPCSGRRNLYTVGLVEAMGLASEQGQVLDFTAFMQQHMTAGKL
eukprot:COSAG03_NODE_1871_length_3405_cov_1.307320_4_plen_124_part_00